MNCLNPYSLTFHVISLLSYVSPYVLSLVWIYIGRPLDSNRPDFRRIVSPPVLGCILGAIFQLYAPLRALLLTSGALFSPVLESLRLMGTAYLPAAMLVRGVCPNIPLHTFSHISILL